MSRKFWCKRSAIQQPQRSRRSTPRRAHARALRLKSLEDRAMLSVTVDILGDVHVDGRTTLREAVAAAAATDTIDFAPSLTAGGPATITLTQGQIQIGDVKLQMQHS